MGLAKRVIPCLDVTAGRVVKGVNFLQLRDAGDPVEIAARYDGEGADELAFLDITASSDERDILLHVVEAVASRVFIPLTVGGGVRKVEDVRRLLNAGADKVSINTSAVRNPGFVREISGIVGNQAIVVAIDAKKKASSWEVFTHGGRKPTGLDAIDWARRVVEAGAGEICSPAWTATARAKASTSRSPARCRRRSASRSSPPAASARSRTSPTGCSRGAPTRCSRRACSTSATSPCARRRST